VQSRQASDEKEGVSLCGTGDSSPALANEPTHFGAALAVWRPERTQTATPLLAPLVMEAKKRKRKSDATIGNVCVKKNKNKKKSLFFGDEFENGGVSAAYMALHWWRSCDFLLLMNYAIYESKKK
jgi:hypothetical protein